MKSKRLRLKTRKGNLSIFVRAAFRLGLHAQESLRELGSMSLPQEAPKELLGKMGVLSPAPSTASPRIKYRSLHLGPVEIRWEGRAQ